MTSSVCIFWFVCFAARCRLIHERQAFAASAAVDFDVAIEISQSLFAAFVGVSAGDAASATVSSNVDGSFFMLLTVTSFTGFLTDYLNFRK